MLDGFNETYSQQLLHFLYYLLLYLSVEYLGKLGHWLGLRVHIQRVHY